jgi:hypothetical protein
MQTRPRREDIPDDIEPADVLYELRLFWYEFMRYRAEVNGDLAWLRNFRSKMTDLTRVLLIVLPVVVASLLAIHVIQT